MDTIYWRMNATQGGANLHPGVHMNTALENKITAITCHVF